LLQAISKLLRRFSVSLSLVENAVLFNTSHSAIAWSPSGV
jgi:hypothetical protein